MHLYLQEGGQVVEALSNLSVGCWCEAGDPRAKYSVFLPMELERIRHEVATHKAVNAELRGDKPRYREEAVYDPVSKKFTVRYVQV